MHWHSDKDDQRAVMLTQLHSTAARNSLISPQLLVVIESGDALNKAFALANGSASDARIKKIIDGCRGQPDAAFGCRG